MVNGLRHNGGLKVGNSGNSDGLTAGGINMVVVQLVGDKPLPLLNLGNHFVGAAGQAKVVDVSSAQHGSQ